MSDADAWTAFIDEITPYVSANWLKYATEHGGQSWVRLIALVDVQNTLTSPQIVEKIASTMADLAVKRPDEERGWQMLQAEAAERRASVLAGLEERAAELLSPELHQLYLRSATPVPGMGM